MSRMLKIALGVAAAALVAIGAVVVYRETDLLTASLVLLAGLMIAALLARRAAAREERAGMADWEHETRASDEAAQELFGEWSVSSPRTSDPVERAPSAPTSAPTPAVAPPVPEHHSSPAAPRPFGSAAPEPDDPSVAISRPLHDDGDEPRGTEDLVASLFADTTTPPAPAPLSTDRGPAAPAAPAAEDPDPLGLDSFISAPPAPAFAGAGAPASTGSHSPIDWTGQGGRVDERVQSSDDILRVSEVTALPAAADTGGSELARLLAKVEARLREYD